MEMQPQIFASNVQLELPHNDPGKGINQGVETSNSDTLRTNSRQWQRTRLDAFVPDLNYDAFFNGPYGMRARYFINGNIGQAYEYAVVRAIGSQQKAKSLFHGNTARYRDYLKNYYGKLWVDPGRKKSDVLIYNGVWEFYYHLIQDVAGVDVGETVEKRIKNMAGTRLIIDKINSQLAKKQGRSMFKGIRADTKNAHGPAFRVMSEWGSSEGVKYDPGKEYRWMEISRIGFV